jgi:hypothetical protein
MEGSEEPTKEAPHKPDPLLVALHGFPDVNTYYADQAGRTATASEE